MTIDKAFADPIFPGGPLRSPVTAAGQKLRYLISPDVSIRKVPHGTYETANHIPHTLDRHDIGCIPEHLIPH